MPILKIAAILSLIFFSSCAKKSEPKKSNVSTHNLDFSGSTFAPHQSHEITMAVIDRDAREIAAQQKLAVSADGTFSGSFFDVLTSGNNYYVAYFADQNLNGSCDAPPTDHNWTVKLDTVSEDTVLALSHNFGFSNNCHMFNAETLKGTTGVELRLTGTVALDPNITDATDLTAGQSLEGAAVFVQGFPDQEALTDSTGAFTLAITLPPEVNLTTNPLKLVTWYTQKNPGQASWNIAKARFGMISDVSGTSGTITMGAVSLTRTNRVRITTKSVATDLPVSNCFLGLTGFDFQVVSTESAAGTYEIDYLPAATYELKVNCPGYELKLFDVEVKPGTDSSKWIILPEIKLTPI